MFHRAGWCLLALLVSSNVAAQPGTPQNADPFTRGGSSERQADMPVDSGALPVGADGEASAVAAGAPHGEPPARARTESADPTADTLLKDALERRDEDPISGQPLTLAELLSSPGDAQTRLTRLEAYWQLASAAAAYRYASADVRFYSEWCDQLAQPAGANTAVDSHSAIPTALRAWLAAAQARQAQREAGFHASQGHLASLLASDTLFWPSDRPHTAVYHTRYESLFPDQTPPPRLTFLFHNLPLAQQAINAEAAAIVAQAEAVEAVEQAWQTGAGTIDDIGSRRAELSRQRRQLLDLVYEYNLAIAEFALSVVPAEVPGDQLAAMLVRPHDGGPSSDHVPAAAQAARYDARAGAGASDVIPASASELAPFPGDTAELDEAPAAAWLVPADLATQPRWGELATVEPLRRAQRLARLVSGAAAAPAEAVLWSLEDCVAAVEPAARAALVAAYWNTVRTAARAAAAQWHAGLLSSIDPTPVLAAEPAAASEIVAAQRSAVADALAALRELEVAQQALMNSVAQQGADRPWPATAFHGGRYGLAIESLSAAQQTDATLRAAAEQLPAWHQLVVEQAALAAEADTIRGEAFAQLATDPGSWRSALAAAARESEHLVALVEALAEYNTVIAQYALRSVPSSAPPGELTPRLVLAEQPSPEN